MIRSLVTLQDYKSAPSFRRSAGGSSGSVFVPSPTNPDLWGWYTGDESYTDTGCTVKATNGQSVAGMKNLSTRSGAAPNLIQVTGGYRPTRINNDFGVFPSVYQDPAGQGTMEMALSPSKAAPLAIFIVAKITTGYPGVNSFYWCGGQTDASPAGQGWSGYGDVNPTPGKIALYWTENNGGSIPTNGYPSVAMGMDFTNFHILSQAVGFPIKEMCALVDNNSSGQPFFSPMTTFRIGHYINGSTSSPGIHWCECLIIDNENYVDLSGSYAKSVLRYFNNKYSMGLTI